MADLRQLVSPRGHCSVAPADQPPTGYLRTMLEHSRLARSKQPTSKPAAKEEKLAGPPPLVGWFTQRQQSDRIRGPKAVPALIVVEDCKATDAKVPLQREAPEVTIIDESSTKKTPKLTNTGSGKLLPSQRLASKLTIIEGSSTKKTPKLTSVPASNVPASLAVSVDSDTAPSISGIITPQEDEVSATEEAGAPASNTPKYLPPHMRPKGAQSVLVVPEAKVEGEKKEQGLRASRWAHDLPRSAASL